MLRIEYESAVCFARDDVRLLDIIKECDELDRNQVVTGFLHYDGGHFRHVLEGPDHVIETLFTNLKSDPRHLIHRVSECSAVSSRDHTGFTFQYVNKIESDALASDLYWAVA